MKQVTITTSAFTRPSCYAALLQSGDHVREIKGEEADATKDRMELMAAVAALEALKFPCIVAVHSDSERLVLGINQDHAAQWRANGWKRKRKPTVFESMNQYRQIERYVARPAGDQYIGVPNADLWERLLDAMKPHQCSFEWVRGHNGDADNERADKLAGMERAKRLPCTEKEPNMKIEEVSV